MQMVCAVLSPLGYLSLWGFCLSHCSRHWDDFLLLDIDVDIFRRYEICRAAFWCRMRHAWEIDRSGIIYFLNKRDVSIRGFLHVQMGPLPSASRMSWSRGARGSTGGVYLNLFKLLITWLPTSVLRPKARQSTTLRVRGGCKFSFSGSSCDTRGLNLLYIKAVSQGLR